MKKSVLLITAMVVFIIATTAVIHASEDIIQPTNIKTLVGKTISFADSFSDRKHTWNFLIVGTSEHFVRLSKHVIIYPSKGVNYWGREVKQITYNANSDKVWWQIELDDEIKNEINEIHVLSIE